jgi:hypothetical protein
LKVEEMLRKRGDVEKSLSARVKEVKRVSSSKVDKEPAEKGS